MQTRQIETIHVIHTRQDKIQICPSPADKKNTNYPCAHYKTSGNKTIPCTLLDPINTRGNKNILTYLNLPNQTRKNETIHVLNTRQDKMKLSLFPADKNS